MGFQAQLSLNAGQKDCRVLQGEQSAILSTFIKLPLVIKIFVLSNFEWPLKTGFTVFISLILPTKFVCWKPLQIVWIKIRSDIPDLDPNCMFLK